MHKIIFTLIAVLTLATSHPVEGCTSMIIGAKASGTGRPMLWKHRDTGAEQNFVDTVQARPGRLGYVALYNGGDSLKREAWMGMNEAGFAIMNTASYNLAPDTAAYKDAEGSVMSIALQRCRTLDDFATLLDSLSRPLGVQANFGVIDAYGHGAYFETDDFHYKIFRLENTDNDVLIRTNHSLSGGDTGGMGYIRFDNVLHIFDTELKNGGFTPDMFTERASRSFYHDLLGYDALEHDGRFAVDQDFIPRRISSASIVIEGINPGGKPEEMVMWTVLGYPPVSHVKKVTIDNVPSELQPSLPGALSPYCQETIERKRLAFPITRGNGQHYVDLDYLRSVMPAQHALSLKAYNHD